MSISGPVLDQIPAGKGQLNLYTWTSTSSSAPFIPIGTLIEQAMVSAPSLGGETAVVGSFTPFGDHEQAGSYFVEVSGTSGLGSLKLAVDGNVTPVAGFPSPRPGQCSASASLVSQGWASIAAAVTAKALKRYAL
jgi:hypothetical protein